MNPVRQLAYQCGASLIIPRKRRLENRLNQFVKIGQKTAAAMLPKSQRSGGKTSTKVSDSDVSREADMQTFATVGSKTLAVSLAKASALARQFPKSASQASDEIISTKTTVPESLTEGAHLSEAEAIQRAQNGNGDAFECLYRLHSRRVYALCLRMVKDPSEAEDLTQEAFLLLFRKIHTFRCESAFSTWLHRLVVNLVLMRLRKKTPPTVSIEATPDPDDEPGQLSIDVGAPDQFLTGSIDRLNLERCLEQLPVGYRAIFVLHDIQGYEHHEIAEMLGRSVGNSKSQLHKARSRMRKLLQEDQREKARNERLKGCKLPPHPTAVVAA